MSRRYAWWIGIFALLMALPFFTADYRMFQMGLIASTAIMALGLVMVIGIAGQISLAQAAFSAIGAYVSTLAAIHSGIVPWFGIPIAALLAGVVGYVLGLATLRLGGHYLALVTMALTAIVQVVLVHWEPVTGGALGLSVPPLAIGGKELTTGFSFYYVVVPVAFGMFLLAANILDSRIGRAFSALCQSEVAAQTLGVNVLHYKSLAFALSAFLGAVGGGFQGLQTSYLDPNLFGIIESVALVAIIIIGGFRSIGGAVIGSAIFVLVPEMLGAFQGYKGLVFAALLLITIVLFPTGLAGLGSVLFSRIQSLVTGRPR
ncbi:MAG: branched-chain amino acid ABC transporter permease [Pseudorhodoplanes sp.]|uniref:branched-chain amino acid ABC transporter permease n=1 Tax=Pseudorhodoplanes sp. TaxID=1934341 RepID=UPI003D0B3FE2